MHRGKFINTQVLTQIQRESLHNHSLGAILNSSYGEIYWGGRGNWADFLQILRLCMGEWWCWNIDRPMCIERNKKRFRNESG